MGIANDQQDGNIHRHRGASRICRQCYVSSFQNQLLLANRWQIAKLYLYKSASIRSCNNYWFIAILAMSWVMICYDTQLWPEWSPCATLISQSMTLLSSSELWRQSTVTDVTQPTDGTPPRLTWTEAIGSRSRSPRSSPWSPPFGFLT